jgi:hypothetical protein
MVTLRLQMAASTTAEESHIVTVSRETWQELLEIAGHQIDPENAEVCWSFAEVADPYGVYPNLTPEYHCIGRFYFARNSGSSLWIEFGDLPDATRDALERKTHTVLTTCDLASNAR